MPATFERSTSTILKPKCIAYIKWFLFFRFITANGQRLKRQDDGDDGDGSTNIEELCQDRPGDEYFRLSTEGDCRDVVR